MRNFVFPRLLAAAGVLAFAGTAMAADVGVAGIYSTRHKVNITDGSKVEIDGYLYIDSDGTMSVYGARTSTHTGKECYYPAGKSAVNYELQGRKLVAGTGPDGQPDYEVKLGEDTFGIYAQADAKGAFRWFYHRGQDDSVATVSGPEHTVNTGEQSFSLTGPRVDALTVTDIRMQLCG